MAAKAVQEDYVIREVTIDDLTAIASLHVATFNETHGGFGPPFEVREFQWQDAFDSLDKKWFCFVIENENGELIGFAKGQPYNHIDLPTYKGELNKIYLLKRYHGLGLGRTLICAVARKFRSQGINNMVLFGDAKNHSNGFYEAMGGQKLYARNGDFHGGYGWHDLTSLARQCD